MLFCQKVYSQIGNRNKNLWESNFTNNLKNGNNIFVRQSLHKFVYLPFQFLETNWWYEEGLSLRGLATTILETIILSIKRIIFARFYYEMNVI